MSPGRPSIRRPQEGLLIGPGPARAMDTLDMGVGTVLSQIDAVKGITLSPSSPASYSNERETMQPLKKKCLAVVGKASDISVCM